MASIDQAAPPIEAHSSPAPVLDRQAVALERNQAGAVEVFAQGIAAAAPTVALASVPGSLFLIAGAGAIWSALLALPVVLLVSYLISQQARRTVSVGSLGTFAGNGLGPAGAFATGWGLLVGYFGFAAGALFGATLYLSSFLDKIGLDVNPMGWKLVVLAAVAVPSIVLPLRGLRFSARIALGLEVASLTAIMAIFVVTWFKHGFSVEIGQLRAHGSNLSSIVVAGVLGVGAYAGFESSASLGFEAKDPHRTIPRVILRMVLIIGALYLIATHTEVEGFVGAHGKLTADSAPLSVVASNAGIGWMDYVIDIGITVSMIAFFSAVVNAGARVLFTFASEGAIPRRLADTHPRFKSPHIAIGLLSAVALLLGVIGTVSHSGRLLFDTYLGIISTWGYLTAYLLVAIATPLYLRRIRALTPPVIVAGVLSTAAIIYVIYKNLVPSPAWPYNILPAIYLALLLLGLLRYAQLRITDPARALRIGRLQELSEEEAARQAGLDATPVTSAI